MTVDLDALKAKLAEYDDSVPRCAKKIARTVNCAPDYLASKDEAYHNYDLTTYSPCCRPEGHEGECRNSRLILGWPGFETVKALVAEVERLRAEAAFLRACVPPTHPSHYGYEAWEERLRAEVAAERAAVVAYLRFAYLRGAANAIERGDHRRREEK